MASKLLTRSCTTPIVVVLGATGAGKSKLAIEIAQKFGGEVISADAVQMYKGLDIVTNKVTAQERQMAKHHCIDFLDPSNDKPFTVVEFRNMALPIIEDLIGKKRIPVICGGTNYYIESLLWKILVGGCEKNSSTEEEEEESDEGEHQASGEERELASQAQRMSNEELHAELTRVDPRRAGELHVNERRRVRRSLQVFRQTKRPHSEILNEQKGEEGGGVLGGPLRFPPNQIAVIWVKCDQKILDQRCDTRVDKMMRAGMLAELKDFQQKHGFTAAAKKETREKATTTTQPGRRRNNEDDDTHQGIFQTIGFKEFREYLSLENDADEKVAAASVAKGVEQMKLVTRQYARRQLKWMNQRFLSPHRDCPKVYGVDSSRYPDFWQEDVHDPAMRIVQAFVDGRLPADISPLPMNTSAYNHEESRKMFFCEVCRLQVKGRLQMDQHLASKKHKSLARKNQPEVAAAEKEGEENSGKCTNPNKAKMTNEIKVIVTNKKSDSVKATKGQRQSAMKAVKAVTGLSFEKVAKMLFEKEEEEEGEPRCFTVQVKGMSQEKVDQVNAGKYDSNFVSMKSTTVTSTS